MIMYSTAKAALTAYSKGLSKSVGSRGVRVNMISPGFIFPSGSSVTVDRIAAAQGVGQQKAVQMLVQQLGIRSTVPAPLPRLPSLRRSCHRRARNTWTASTT